MFMTMLVQRARGLPQDLLAVQLQPVLPRRPLHQQGLRGARTRPQASYKISKIGARLRLSVFLSEPHDSKVYSLAGVAIPKQTELAECARTE